MHCGIKRRRLPGQDGPISGVTRSVWRVVTVRRITVAVGWAVAIRTAVVAVAAIRPVIVAPVVAAGLLVGDDAADGAGNGTERGCRAGIAAAVMAIVTLARAQLVIAGGDDAAFLHGASRCGCRRLR